MEHELHEIAILDPLEGCTLCTMTVDITRAIENVKDLVTKLKAGKIKLQCQKDQLSAALETEEERGHTRASSLIASRKEGIAEDSHMCKKRGRHNKDVEPVNNDEEQFVTHFFNFMIKHIDIVISHVSVP
jgi:hypothetical protein